MSNEKQPGTSAEKEGSNLLDLGLKVIIDTASKTFAGSQQENEPVSGLSEVLTKSAELAEQRAEEASKEKAPEQGLVPFELTTDSPDYESLAGKARWKDLGALCEKRLADSSESDVEAKVWWIKSQFASKSIPLTILAPSLDSASRLLLSEPGQLASDARKAKLAGIATTLLSDFAKHLQRDKDYELAVAFLERAYRVDPTLKDQLRESVKAQIALASEKESSFSAEHVQTLKRLGIELMLPSGETREKFSKPAYAENIPSPKQTRPFAGRGREIVVGLLTLAFLILAAMQLFKFGGDYIEKREVVSHELKPSMPIEMAAVSPALLAPFPELSNGLTHLDAVYYDFNKTDSSPSVTNTALSPQLPAKVDTQPVAQLPDSPAPFDPVANDAKLPRPRLGKDTVNTTSPVIAPEFPRYEPDQGDEIPTIDFPPYRQPKSRRDRADDQMAGDRSGTIAGGERYVIIARTKVMEEPSYYAFSPADLYEGDEIRVEANLGKWLRIRTRRGGVAYVLAQDAARVNP